jgi:hypothetical protein
MRLVLLAVLMAPALLARADHPMLTEDADVLGKDVWQLELHGEAIEGERDEAGAVLSFGITGKADLQLDLPRHGEDSLALKWRFFESGPARAIFKPAVTDSGWGASLAAAYDFDPVEIIGHAGIARADGESSKHYSIAFLWSVRPVLKLVADFARDTNPGRDTQAFGFLYQLADDVDLGFGRKTGDERAWLFGAKLRW